MINCIYLNPTIDYTVYTDEFKTGGTNIAEKALINGAGKAINVAEVLTVLGVPSNLLGFAFNRDAGILRERLSASGTPYKFIELDGNSRLNIKIFDNSKSQVTEVNGQGAPIDFFYSDSITTLISGCCNSGDITVLAGRLPAGWPDNYYASLIRLFSNRGVLTALDTSGEALRLGVIEAPFIIKPNICELEYFAGYSLNNFEKIAKICTEILELGVKIVCVSMGENGAYMFVPGNAYFAEPVRVRVCSTVGAGDSMLAGILANINCGVETAFRSGVAAAAASLTVEGTCFPPVDVYNDMLGEVNIMHIAEI